MKAKVLLTASAVLLGSLLGTAAPRAAFAETGDKVTTDKDFAEKLEKYLGTEAGQDLVGKAAKSFLIREQATMEKQAAERQQQQMEEFFKKPVNVEVGKSPVKGPAGAKVTVIEFSDFQCPYCSRGKDIMEQVLKAYPNDVKVVFKNLPLPFHKEAMPAAKAALAAGKQNKFWEMHDALFANQQSLGQELYESKAKELGLDVEKFKTDMNAPELEALIKEDAKLAESLEIRGTPGFFVNGVPVKGAYPLEHFKGIIDRWLGKTTAKS